MTHRICSVAECDCPTLARGWCGAHYRRWHRTGTIADPIRRSRNLDWVHELVANPRPCGEADWPFGKTRSGYGAVKVAGKQWAAHRLVLTLFAGSPEVEQWETLHACDRPVCCSPECLRWGTRQENAADRVSRDRGARGSRQGLAKLTDDVVAEIRRRYAGGGINQYELASEYGVHQGTISSIVRGATWTHVAHP